MAAIRNGGRECLNLGSLPIIDEEVNKQFADKKKAMRDAAIVSGHASCVGCIFVDGDAKACTLEVTGPILNTGPVEVLLNAPRVDVGAVLARQGLELALPLRVTHGDGFNRELFGTELAVA